MIISPHAQYSAEWFLARCGIPTASEFDALITPLGKIKTGEGVQTYLAKKLAEKWTGLPVDAAGSFHAEQGSILESECRPTLGLILGATISDVGLITNDDGTAGCSPDGLIDGRIGVEIKCPKAETHVKYLLAGVIPPEYVAQVYGSLYVTGFEEWIFCSYRRGFPPLIVRVNCADITDWMSNLETALDDFHRRLSEGMQKLKEIDEK